MPARHRERLAAWGIWGAALVVLPAGFWMVPVIEALAAVLPLDMGAEELTSGRTVIYRLVLDAMGENGPWALLAGNGAGAVEHLVGEAPQFGGRVVLAHNEFLSLCYDFGLLGASAICVALVRMWRAGPNNGLVMLYVILVVAVENLLPISLVFMVVLVLLAGREQDSEVARA